MPTDSFIKRFFYNPALGLLPLLVFSILIKQVDIYYTYLLGFGLSVLPFIFRIRKGQRVLYDISALSLLVSFLIISALQFKIQPLQLFILTEGVLLFFLIILRFSRKSLVRKVLKNENDEIKFCFYEALQVANQFQYALMFHFIILLGYRLFSDLISSFLVLNLFQIIVVLVIALEAVRLRLLNNRLRSEEWLPVISESGAVQGRIAKSVSIIMKNKFLHPIVRIALIYDGMVYLKARDNNRLLDPGKLDYPFETYMQYKHNIEDAIKNVTKNEIKTESIPVRFILKYVFENECTKRLVFLYVSNIYSEEEFNKLSLQGGKLWTTNQIEENIGSGIFSETFELEYEYLKNTVLMSEWTFRKSQ